MPNQDLDHLSNEPVEMEELTEDDLEDVAGGWAGDGDPAGGG